MSDLRPALQVVVVVVVAFVIGSTTGPVLAVLVEALVGVHIPWSLAATVVPALMWARAYRNLP